MSRPSRLYAALHEFHDWLLSGHCRIKDRSGDLVALYPNAYQQQLWEIMVTQAWAGQPIRLICLKARKTGCSTFAQALAYWLTANRPHFMAITLAHQEDSTRQIFGITQRIYRNDPGRIERLKRGNVRELSYDHDSQFLTITAGGKYVVSGGTPNMVHWSELSKSPGDALAIEDQLASVLNSVPDDPESIVIIESTANAREPKRPPEFAIGHFESRWRVSGYVTS